MEPWKPLHIPENNHMFLNATTLKLKSPRLGNGFFLLKSVFSQLLPGKRVAVQFVKNLLCLGNVTWSFRKT